MKKIVNLGEKLKQARKHKKFSQKYVCELFEIKQSTFSSWERGVSEPNVNTLVKLCSLYGIYNISKFVTTDDMDTFLKTENILSENDENLISTRIDNLIEKRLIEDFRLLDNRGRTTVLETIKKQVELSREEHTEKVIPFKFKKTEDAELREIRVYSQPAAAGLGNYLDDESDYDIVLTTAPRLADVGIRISGDSMEPMIENGSTVWVKRCEYIDNGTVGIFILNGNAYCKILNITNDGAFLKSANPKYDDIKIDETDTFMVYGKVLFGE